MRLRPTDASNLCQAAVSNLERAASAILAAPRPKPVKRSAPGWQRARKPRYFDRVRERFALTANETKLLDKNGFVVLAREEQVSYVTAFHEIYQSQLPLYVTADAVLHAVFNGHDSAIALLEQTMAGHMSSALDAMHAALPRAAKNYPPEVARDVDVYLTVARSLYGPEPIASKLGTDAIANSLVDDATRASALKQVELFGRKRMIDFSRYQPRGRYAKTDGLAPYFRAATWLANLELNLVSRGGRSSAPGFVPDPRETPREALVALALADLASRSGSAQKWASLDATWSTLGGIREDVSLAELSALRRTAGIGSLRDADAFDRLKAAIGNHHQRSTRIHYMPQGSRPLPAIATLLGPRITADTTALAGLVHSDVASRFDIRAGDIGALLGHDAARRWLTNDLGRHPTLAAQLATGRGTLAQSATNNLHGAWIGALRTLASKPEGTLPSFTESSAFSSLRLNSALVGYGQLKQSYVLVAAQAYDEGGCEIPDGYVDPVPALYAALGGYAKQGAALAHALGESSVETYFRRLQTRLEVLEAIAEHQLSGEPPSEEMRRWFSMVAEVTPASSDSPGSYDGWYFEMFNHRYEAFESPAFISDVYASVNTGNVMHLGATAPRMALFVIDVGGEPRMAVGPVARGFERIEARRVTQTDKGGSDPWAKQYTAPAPPTPRVALRVLGSTTTATHDEYRIAVRAGSDVTVDLLDHHRQLIASGTSRAGKLVVRAPIGTFPEAVRVRVGAFSHIERTYTPAFLSIVLGGATEIEER